MDIVVCAKQIFDLGQIKVDSSGRPVKEGVTRKISDFDKNAIEEGVRLRDKHSGRLTVLVGGAKDAAKEALAMGADEAVIFSAGSDPLGTALIISGILGDMKYDLIICGEASIDEYSFQVGPRVAQALGIPVLTYAKKIEISDGDVIAERILEDRYEVVKAKLPAVVTVNKEINEPGIPTLMQILGASKKKMTEITPEKTETGIETVNIQAIEMKRKGIIMKDIGELARVILAERQV